MSSGGWIKLWLDILDDVKVFEMSDSVFKRFIYFLLLAKEYDRDGMLPPIKDMAWRLRLSEKQITEALQKLQELNVIHEDSGNYLINNFAKRQAVKDSVLRVRKYREKRKELGMNSGYSYDPLIIYERDNNECVYCGSKINICVDHAYPITLGGTDNSDNLVCACKICNCGKSGRTPEQAGFKFLNKNAESRYKKYLLEYVTVTGNDNVTAAGLSSTSTSLSLSTFQVYENEIGVITKTIADEIILYENELGEKWMIDAIREASKASGRSWNYVKAILNRWKTQGNQNDMRTKKEESKPKEIIIDPDGGMYL